MTISLAPDKAFEILSSYIDLGLAVLPLWGIKNGSCACPKGKDCKNAGKHPDARRAPNGVKNATRDKALLRQWSRTANSNWAVRCGEPLVGGGFLIVLDVDPRNGGTTVGLPTLPETCTQETGGGGQHYLFKAPESISSRTLGPGLDLQAAGKYIVVDPSVHASGGTYSWAMGHGVGDLAIADAPPWMLEGAGGAEARPPREGDGTARDTVLGEAFSVAGMLGMELPGGVVAVKCPWADEHSDARGRGQDSSTVILPPAGGMLAGGFRCMHSHCANRKWHDVMAALPEHAAKAGRDKYPPKPVDASELPTEAVPTVADDDPLKDVKQRLAYKITQAGFAPKSDVVNLVTILTYDPRWAGLLVWDDFGQVLRKRREPPWHPDDKPRLYDETWSDDDFSRMDAWLRRYWAIESKAEAIRQAVYIVGRRESVNPLQDYVNGLVWDGKPRLDAWLTRYLGAEPTEYHRLVGAKWMISCIARALEPGCKVDTIMVLEGDQGRGKSSALRALVPYYEWFSDTPIDLSSKDAYVALRGRWIIEIAELASFSKAEQDRTKAFLSSPVDHYRPPYGREQVAVKRQCIFAGTVNHGVYLRDETGARRYWGVKTGTIDLDGLREDRNQLWAEARDRFRKGETWWPSYEESSLFDEEQETRTEADVWEESVSAWLNTSGAQALIKKQQGLTVGDLLEGALRIAPKDATRSEQTRIGYIMSRMRWGKSRRTVGGKGRVWLFTPPATFGTGRF